MNDNAVHLVKNQMTDTQQSTEKAACDAGFKTQIQTAPTTLALEVQMKNPNV